MSNRIVNDLFPEAKQYPQFFHENLNDPSRVLKVLEGEDCWARVFYFQLLKLIFEIESQNNRSSSFSDILMNSIKNAIESATSTANKNKLMEHFKTIEIFLKNLENNQDLEFETFINQNTYIDEAIIQSLKQNIRDAGFQKGSVIQKLRFMGQAFQQTLYEFENGLKFQQSDTFVYVENQNSIFLAFLSFTDTVENQIQPHIQQQERTINTQKEYKNNQQNIPDSQNGQYKQNRQYDQSNSEKQQNLYNHHQQYEPFEQHKSNEEMIKRESPVDYLFSKKYGQEHPNSFNSQLHSDSQSNEASARFRTDLELTLGVPKQKNKDINIGYLLNGSSSKKSQAISNSFGQGSKFKNSSSSVDQFTQYQDQKSISLYKNEDLFYKPSNYKDTHVTKSLKKDALDLIDNSEKGTFYRKFTNTKILNIISQPHRTKIKMIKTRFVGVHTQHNQLFRR